MLRTLAFSPALGFAIAVFATGTAAIPLAAQTPASLRYDFTISSEKGESSPGTAYVLGDASRIETPRSGDDFMIMRPGHLYSVHPDKREYSDNPPELLADVIGNALRATRLIVRFDLSDVEIGAQDLGGDELVAGIATRHYRIVQRFTVTVHPLIIGSTDEAPEKNEVVTDYWVAKGLKLPRNPLVEMLVSAPSAIAQQDQDFARRSIVVRDSLFTGTPLKVQVTTRKKGEHAKDALTFEVTRVTQAPVSPALLEIPAGYRRVEGLSIHSM